MVASLFVVAGLPLGLSLAQVEPSIQLLNPTPGTSLVVSDKQQSFRLNSWVDAVPQGPLVEYELDITTDDPVGGTETQTWLLGEATHSGNGFDLLWDIPDQVVDTNTEGPNATTYVIRAILHAGYTGPGTGTTVAVDESPITINRNDDPDPTQHSTEDAGETVQITYPTNGGPLGVYIRPKGGGGNFTIDAIVSQHTRFLRPFYTISQPGEEPRWKSCGIAGGRLSIVGNVRTMRIQCATGQGDYALDVTGVAVVTNDTPAPTPAGLARAEFNDGADALVVDPYFQTVGSVTIDPLGADSVDVDTGCPAFTATVLDQLSRPIGNMNVDIHLQRAQRSVAVRDRVPRSRREQLEQAPGQRSSVAGAGSELSHGAQGGVGRQTVGACRSRRSGHEAHRVHERHRSGRQVHVRGNRRQGR